MSEEKRHIRFVSSGGADDSQLPLDEISWPLDDPRIPREYRLAWTEDIVRMQTEKYLRILEKQLQKISMSVRLKHLQLTEDDPQLDIQVLAYRFFVQSLLVDFKAVTSFLMATKGLIQHLENRFPRRQDLWANYVSVMNDAGPLDVYLNLREEVKKSFSGKFEDQFELFFSALPQYLKMFWPQLSTLLLAFPEIVQNIPVRPKSKK
jgi:hypothetical protein